MAEGGGRPGSAGVCCARWRSGIGRESGEGAAVGPPGHGGRLRRVAESAREGGLGRERRNAAEMAERGEWQKWQDGRGVGMSERLGIGRNGQKGGKTELAEWQNGRTVGGGGCRVGCGWVESTAASASSAGRPSRCSGATNTDSDADLDADSDTVLGLSTVSDGADGGGVGRAAETCGNSSVAF